MIFEETGKYYGYPQCCIEGFANETSRTEHQNNFNVHKGYGFIPCPLHAKQISEGKIQLKNLISSDRKCLTSFPIDDMDVETLLSK